MTKRVERKGFRLAGWQVTTLAVAGGLGAIALANQLSALGVGEPENPLSGDDGLYAWKHGDVHYTVKGRGEPLLLVHGVYAGASSYEYRRVFDLLAERYRVYAMDLLGFGRSKRPAIMYTPRLYIELIQDFARQVIGASDHPISVIASSLGAAFAIRAAAERPDLFARLALIEPTGIETLAGQSDAGAVRLWRAFLRAPLFGEAAYNLVVSRPSIRYFLQAQAYADGATVSDDMVDYYYATAHQPGARFAPASFIAGALDTPTETAFSMLRQPVVLLWGEYDRFNALDRAQAFLAANDDATLLIFPTGGLPQDEQPAAFTREVMGWMASASQALR